MYALTFLCTMMAMAQPADPAAAPTASVIDTVALPSPNSPMIAIRLMFKAGSIHDPAGKKGLAALTAAMIAEAGTRQHTYPELVEALYPMAASIGGRAEREVTVFTGEIHRDNLKAYTQLLLEALLEPRFAAEDFTRNKEQLLAYLTNTLRVNDELLGLETLQEVIYEGHPYGHAPQGAVNDLGALTLDDVKRFYESHYTQANLILGIAGGYPADYPGAVQQALAALPRGTPGGTALPPVPPVEGRSFTLIDKKTDSVGIHFGFPLTINRADPDYYPLMVANSFLGEHRTFHGRLMQQLRGKRGLNYGDYSYIEYWHRPPNTNHPTPNVPRRQQYFSVWLRPVVPATAQFALRNALHELDRLIERGLTSEELALTRDFLINYSKLWAQTLSDRLGFHMDSRYYGMNYYIDEIEQRLRQVTPEQVHDAIRKHLRSDRYKAVMVTANAAALRAALEQDQPSPMQYNTPPEEEVQAADRIIEARPVQPTSFRIVPVEQMFEK